MGVTEIHGDADWNTQMSKAGGKLVVVDFSAVWCVWRWSFLRRCGLGVG